MKMKSIKGIKVMVSGRLGGAEMSRREWAKEGRIPLHTLRADIDYGFYEARTSFGAIGCKVWVFKGEIVPERRTTEQRPRREAPVAQPQAAATLAPAPTPAAPAPQA
jgi:small subunit ribosomal protein S3